MKKTFLIPISETQEKKLTFMIDWCFPNLDYMITHFRNASLHISYTIDGTVVIKNSENYPNTVHWLEFVLIILSKEILGEKDPNSRRNRKPRRAYNMARMASIFGKQHPVDFLYEELRVKVKNQGTSKQLEWEIFNN